MVGARCVRLPSDIWPRHYIGALTGIFKPDSGIFRWASGISAPGDGKERRIPTPRMGGSASGSELPHLMYRQQEVSPERVARAAIPELAAGAGVRMRRDHAGRRRARPNFQQQPMKGLTPDFSRVLRRPPRRSTQSRPQSRATNRANEDPARAKIAQTGQQNVDAVGRPATRHGVTPDKTPVTVCPGS
jgi:hypothetical protein